MAQYQPQLDAALQDIGTVHYARSIVLGPASQNLQPSATSTSFVLGIITEYDGSFDAYMGDFVSVVGPVFDALLQFVVGGAARAASNPSLVTAQGDLEVVEKHRRCIEVM